MPRRRLHGRSTLRVSRVLLAPIAWAAGCEALVDGKLGAVDCLDEGADGPPACQSGYWCSGGRCIPYAVDAACSSDADCAMGDFCLEPGALGTAGGRCSRACCNSGDCDPLFVCAAAPAGGVDLCQPASEVGRASGGVLDAMHACVADADCRSGRCLD